MQTYRKIAAILAGASVLSSAALAIAAPAELNLFGASAQFDFWSANARPYMIAASTAGGLGCTVAASNSKTVQFTISTNNTVKHGLAIGTACTSTLVPVNAATGTRDLTIRWGGIASGEGIWAVGGKAPLETDLLRFPLVASPAPTCNAANSERAQLADIATTNLECHQIHVGTSDVEGKNINQKVNDSVYTDAGQNILTAAKMAELILPATYRRDQAIVVPFCFYANSNVKAHHCEDANGKWTGQYCTTTADCPQVGAPWTNPISCNTTANTISNLSRLEAVMIFSCQVPSWKYLGDYFGQVNMVNDAGAGACKGDANYSGTDCVGTAADIITKVCHRIPGSGTLAGLEYTVMTGGGTGWGSSMNNCAANDASGPPLVQFNKSTGDMKTCITSAAGGIGYMDCDQTQTGAVQLNYQGVGPCRSNIRNGIYDFYTVGNMYSLSASTKATLIANIVAWSKKPANIPTSKAAWWASLEEMKYRRTLDTAYPSYQGADTPMLP